MSDRSSRLIGCGLGAIFVAMALSGSPARAEMPGAFSSPGSIQMVAERLPARPAIRRGDLEMFTPVHRPAHYVILASVVGGQGVPPAKMRAMAQCLGVAPHYIDSGFFKGLRQGLSLAIFGAFSKEKAIAVQTWARRCVPDAYIRTAIWNGD